MTPRARHLTALGLYLGLTLLLTWPLAREWGRAIPGDSFDGWQNFWNLWWVRQALLVEHTHPYITSLLYHPQGVSLWFQTLNIFNGLTFLPVQLAGGLYWAYNGVVIFSFVAAGYGAMLLALHVLSQVGARPGPALWAAAFGAGVIFTFSPFHFAHLLGHMQVFSLQFTPFYLLYLLRALPPGQPGLRRRDALLAGLFLILAGLCDWYFVLYLALFTAFYLLWLGLRRALHPAHLAALGLIGLLFLAVTAPLLAPMVRESLRYDFMRPPPGQIEALSADLLAFFIPSGQHPLWGAWAAEMRASFPASPSETTLFIGLTPLVLALIGLRRGAGPEGRGLRLRFWVLAALLFALFALGPVLHVGGQRVMLGDQPLRLPYALLLRLPFIEIARTVARYDLLVMLSLGVLAGGGMYRLLATRRVWPWAGLLIGLILFEFAPLPYPLSPPDTPDWYKTLAQEQETGAVLNLPMNWDRPGYLLYQTVHGKPLTAGYISRDDPHTYPTRLPLLSHLRHLQPDIHEIDPAAFASTLFRFLEVRWVVIDRYKMPGGAERQVTDALVAAIFAADQPLYEDERITVYAAPWAAEPLPFIELGPEWGLLQPQGRPIEARAGLLIHSSAPRSLNLALRPGPGPAPAFWLADASGEILPHDQGQPGRWRLALRPGANAFTLHTDAPGLWVERLWIED